MRSFWVLFAVAVTTVSPSPLAQAREGVPQFQVDAFWPTGRVR